MSYFARLDEQNKVIHVSKVSDSKLTFGEEESSGVAFLKRLHGSDTTWIRLSRDGSFRGRFAGPGYTYDSTVDAFVAPQVFSSWEREDDVWAPPIPKPTDPGDWEWDEGFGAWVDITGQLTKVDFVLRFTGAEHDLIKASTDPEVVFARNRLNQVRRILPHHPEAQQYIAMLNSKGLLDHAGRPDEILATN